MVYDRSCSAIRINSVVKKKNPKTDALVQNKWKTAEKDQTSIMPLEWHVLYPTSMQKLKVLVPSAWGISL